MDFSVGLSPLTFELKFLYVSKECRIGLLNLQPSLKPKFNGLKELETFCNCLLVPREVRCLPVTVSLTWPIYLRYEITSQLYGVDLRGPVWSQSVFLSSVSWVSLGLLSSTIGQPQNCSKLCLAVTSRQGDCKSDELNISFLTHEFFSS